MSKEYDVGDRARLSVSFTDAAGVAVDPTTVACKIRLPDGTETTYTHGVDDEVVKDSVGNYHLDFTITVHSNHFYRWVGTGAAVAAGENGFKVRKSTFSSP